MLTMFTLIWILCLLGTVGTVTTVDNITESPGTLRKTLHGPPVGAAPTSLEDALTVAASVGGSHFQKLPGKSVILSEKIEHVILTKFSPLQREPTN